MCRNRKKRGVHMADYLSQDLYESIMEDIDEAYANKDKARLLELRKEVEEYARAGDDDEGGRARTLIYKIGKYV